MERRRCGRRCAAGGGRPTARAGSGATGGPPAWWPRLTPSQVQTLVGAAITLAIALWEHLRGRVER